MDQNRGCGAFFDFRIQYFALAGADGFGEVGEMAAAFLALRSRGLFLAKPTLVA